MYRLLLFALLTTSFCFASDQISVCVAQPNGPEAKHWKLQAPIAKRIEQDASAMQLNVVAPLLSSDTEKNAKQEASGKNCSYILLTTLESNRDQVFGTFNPNPAGRSQGDINRSVNATPQALNLKYKLIKTAGKKMAATSVPMFVKENPSASDFEEAGHKMIETLASQVLAAIHPAK
jgi:hypothetical protein